MQARAPEARSGVGRWLWLVLLAALAIRVAWAVAAPTVDPYLRADPLFGDAADYDRLARNLVAGNGFAIDPPELTAGGAPFYPLFLSGLYVLAGPSLGLVRLVQAGLGALAVLLTYLTGSRLWDGRVGLIGAIVAAFYPTLIYFGGWVVTEALYVALLSACVYCLVRSVSAPGPVWVALAGLLAGLATLTRPQTLLALPLLALGVAWAHRGAPGRVWLGRIVLFAALAAVVVGAWTARNYTVYQEIVLVDTHGGYSIYGSYDPDAGGAWVEKLVPREPGDTELSYDRRYYRAFFVWLRENYPVAIALIPAKILRLLSPTTTVVGEYKAWWTPLTTAGNLAFVAVAVYGGYLAARTRREAVWLWAVVLSTVATAVIFYGTSRFALPMIPALGIFAGVALRRHRLV